MAESNQRKIAEPIALDEEDPFAELTRIMGFDPRASVVREPVIAANTAKPAVVAPIAPKASQPTPVPAQPVAAIWQPAPAAYHDDFAIDLEKELLGGFSDFDLPADPAPVATAAPVVAAPATSAQPTAVDDAFDEAFSDIGELDALEAELSGAAVATVDRDAFEHTVAGDIAYHLAGTAALPEPVLSDDAFDDAVAAELGAYEAQPVTVIAEPVGYSDALDDAVAAELQAYDEELVAASAEPLEYALDLAAAENFGVEDQQPAVAPEAAYHAEPMDPAITAETGGYAAEPGHDDLTLEFDLDDLHVAHAAPVEALHAPVEQAATAEVSHVADPIDPLADVDMDFGAAFDRQFAADARDDPAAPAQAAPAVAEAELPAPTFASTADDHIELSLEDELNALLESSHAEPRAPVAATTAATLAAVPPAALLQAVSHASKPVVGRSHFESDSRWAALEADEEDGSVDDAPTFARAGAAGLEARRPFGDPSLTGRFANFPLPAAQAVAPQPPAEDLDALLDAMEHEVHATDEPQPAQPVVAAPVEDGYAYRAAAEAPAAPAYDNYAEEVGEEPVYAGAPDIETVDVPETSVPLADELDIPELAYQEDERQAAAYDDIDADFAATFNETAISEEPVNQAVRGTARPTEHADIEAEFEALYRPAFAQAATAPEAEPDDGYYEVFAADEQQEARAEDEYEDFAPASTPNAQERFVDLDFDTDLAEEAAPAVAAQQLRTDRPQRRGLLVAAVVGGVALLGGVGALALSYGGGDRTQAPVLVKADDGPVKVKPENPGGTAVPNQDNKVYDAVKGTAAAAPQAPAQERLVTTAEEPVDMAAVEQADALPGVNNVEDIIAKSEERVVPQDADQDEATESIAVAPRKVKTMVVRSDGTLVAREETAEPALSDQAAAGVESTGAVAAAEDGPSYQAPGSDETVPVKTVKTAKVTAEGKPAATDIPAKPVKSTKVDATGKPQVVAEAPALAPANLEGEAPSQPAQPEAAAVEPAQPAPAAAKPTEAKAVEAKPAETKPEEVATANVEPTAVATGAWSVQIASQPSAEAAKSTYQDLAGRFGSVIGGRGVNIVKAEIDGKGTYWRVRVPAKSRNDAVKLCTDYKAAGGNCFVSK